MNVQPNPRNANIQVRVNAMEKALIEKKAEERGLSVAAYVRSVALSAK